MADQLRRCLRYRQLLVLAAVALLGANDARKAYSSSFTPNFDPDYPQFTPFAAADFVAHVSDELALSDAADGDRVAAMSATVAAAPKYSSYVSSPSFGQKHHQPPASSEMYDAGDADADGGFEAVIPDDMRPFKTFVLDMYKNYRNQYLTAGNQTIGGMLGVSSSQLAQVIEEHQTDVPMLAQSEPLPLRSPRPTTKLTRRKTKPKRTQSAPASSSVPSPVPSMPHPNALSFDDDEVKYNVGPGVNISVDAKKELVNVFLDEDCLKDVFTGRGRKHDLISKILPLFILPFLIQSAIVPFAVTTLKLLLVKSILVGKIAIFLLIISALKNHHTKYAAYDSPSPYVVDPPSRRSEASSSIGYRVEGKPTTWVN